jgi:HEAT repeat protein/ATP/ADP translocase
LKPWLTRLAPIYPGEGRIVALCLAVNFLVVAGIMYGRNARDSLFLNNFGVQYLPYMYFANAVVLVVCSLFYTSLVDRLDRGKFLAGVSLIFVALLVGSRAVLAAQPRWFYPVLYILAQAIWNFSLLQFWTFLGDLFDTRQAKRLFPLIAIGSLLGMIGVGLTSRPAVNALGTENILLVWAGLIFTALVLGSIVYRSYSAAKSALPKDKASLPPPRKASEWDKFKEGTLQLRQEPLLRNMALVTFLLWTVFTLVDFSFNKVMKETYPDKDVLTAFLGGFRGIAGFLCLVIQLFLTSTLISRLGVGTTIAFHPFYLTLSTLWMTLSFGYTSVYAAKLGDHVLLYTFQDSSFQLLYSPVPLERRARIRGFIDGYIKPLSMAAAGVLLLLGTRYLELRQIAMIGLVLAFAWLAVSLSTKKGYIRALLQNLQADSPALRQAAATALAKLRDPSSLGILADTLRSASSERVIAAMQFLESFGTEQANEALAELLNHPDSRVRATAVSTLGRRAATRYIERLTPLLDDPDARVRANVIEALASAEDPALMEKLRPLLQDPSSRARVNTVLTIATIQGVSAALESLPLIRSLSEGDARARATATYALGRLPLEQSVELLAALLHDPELRIRCEAAQALGRIGLPPAIPSLVEALAGPPQLRHDARRSLAAIVTKCGATCAQELMQIAVASDRPEIRSELADVLGRLKSLQVVPTLVRLLKDPEWRVRWKVLKSFERLARDGPLPESARLALFNYAQDELTAFRQSLLCSQTLTPRPTGEAERLLAQALEEDRVNIEERVFHMLGIVCGRDRMLTVFQKLRSGDARLRADALEALDTLAPKEIGREVLALLEPAPTASASAAPAAPLLAALAKHSKPWMRACTAYYLGSHLSGNGESLLQALLDDPSPLVRETALYAGWQAFRDAWRPRLDAASQSSDPALRRAAEKALAPAAHASGDAPPSLDRSGPMLLTVEKALFLKSAPLFAGLEGEELAALADIALQHAYEPGEIIFEENQPPHHLYVIVEGKVEVFRRAGSVERTLAYLGEKECFGEMAILDDQPRSASVRAVERTDVLKIDRDSFRELILERPQIAFAIFKILSGRLRHQNLEADHLPAVYSGGQYA